MFSLYPFAILTNKKVKTRWSFIYYWKQIIWKWK